MSKPELEKRLHSLQSAPETGPEVQAIMHELEVHQIELEMQLRELKESREELEASHDRYVNLYDFSPIGYVTLTGEGIIREINLKACRLLGVERRWLTDRSLAPWIQVTELPLFRSHMKKARESSESVTTILHLVRNDQRAFPVELSSETTKNPSTGEFEIKTSITDLTDRRNAEEERDRFFELSRDLLCVMHADGFFERLNRSWEETLGYSREDLLARPYVDFVHPDDRDRWAIEFERVKRGLPLTPGFQNRFVKSDRSIIWLTWSGVFTDGTFYGVARDTTRETHARELIQNQNSWLGDLIQDLPLPLFLADIETGSIISMSTETLALLDGFTFSESDQQPDSPFYYTDAAGKRLPLKDWPRFLATRGKILNGEEMTWNTPRARVHIQVWSRIIAPKFGQPGMVLVILQNIDSLKQKEASLVQAVSSLETERSMREDFVSALTHDLRTPLTAARMSAQLLARPNIQAGDDRNKNRLTSNLVKSIDRIDFMIRDLLDANSIRAGQELALQLTRFDLVRLTSATLEEFSEVHGKRFELNASGKIYGLWSKQHVRRVIENLLTNAVKYGSRKRAITVTIAQSTENQVTLAVHNFGAPIPQAEQASLFEQFRRAHSAIAGNKKGWGLGLTLVKGIVEAHGGEVNVTSSQESGTTFTVTLPMSREPART